MTKDDTSGSGGKSSTKSQSVATDQIEVVRQSGDSEYKGAFEIERGKHDGSSEEDQR